MSKYSRKKPEPAPTPDEFVSFWDGVYKRVAPYLRSGFVAVGGALALLVAVWAVLGWMERKAQSADAALAASLRLQAAELLPADSKTTPKPKEGEAPRFKTDKERDEALLASLDAFDKAYAGAQVAPSSQWLRAGALYRQGKLDDAAVAYGAVASTAQSPALRVLAIEAQGIVAESQGKADEALKQFERMAAEPAPGNFGRDRALYHQGRLLLKKGDKAKALSAFKEALVKVPQSSLKDEIQTQVLLLEGA
jgi:predicted negative regulator of RcsB-dependent stress response